MSEPKESLVEWENGWENESWESPKFDDMVREMNQNLKEKNKYLVKKMNDNKKMEAKERRCFLKEFMTALLKNRINFKYSGRQILEYKLRQLPKMSDKETQDCFRYLADVFMLKYVPTKMPRNVSKKYEPVIQIKKRKGTEKRDSLKQKPRFTVSSDSDE